ncbi:DUF6053 domain-containing protein [Lysobacter yananisis]|uniref:DUF6053 domain-containing protein n=1 Tax=Lysobacter yananisis TaxID=1003114 RepID=UPI003CE4F0F2
MAGGPSGPPLSFRIAAIGNKSVGSEARPTGVKPPALSRCPPRSTRACRSAHSA